MSFFIHFLMLFALLFGTTVYASVGKVSLLKGEATLQREAQKTPLKNGAILEEKDILVTAKNSQIQLIFEDKTVITLGEESEFKIEEYFNDAKNPKAKFKFGQGTFKTITGQIGKTAPDNFTLETKTATIGIRGTTVTGKISENGDAIGCTSGSIIVKLFGSDGFVIVPAGKVTFVAPGKEPTPPTDIKSEDLAQNHRKASDKKPSSEIPGAVSSASDSSLQDKTQQIITTYVKNNSFYPTFIPTLISDTISDGTISLSGFATSEFRLDGVRTTSIDDTFILNINTEDDSVNSDSTISLQNRTVASSQSLEKSADSSTLTYKTINRFSIKDFNDEKGWMQTENTYTNDYISWGYWAINSSDSSKLTTKKNYWVGGIDSDACLAETYISGLATSTHYFYTGQVIGDVEEAGLHYTIDSSTSSVQLKFDFGGGTNSLYNDASYSWIRFSANGKQWDLKPTLTTPTVTSGTFSDGLTGTVTSGLVAPVTSGAIKGKFYGDEAQAVGGTFTAATAASKAVGVFKAVKE